MATSRGSPGPGPGLAFALLLSLCASAYAAAGQCKPGCAVGGGQKYQTGHTYEYQVTSTSKTSMYGSGDGEKLDISATALLTAAGNCNYVLRLKNVKIESAGKTHAGTGDLKELEDNPVLFNMDGEVTRGEICSSPKEHQDTLNVKRAIISSLQLSRLGPSGSGTRYEIDVYGYCPTEISSEKHGDVNVIKKRRNLLQCSHREALRQDFITTERSSGGSSPLLLSDWSHQQKVKNHIVQEAATEETYSYRPLANDAVGAQTHIVTRVKLVKEAAATPGDEKADQAKKVQSLIFSAPTHTHRGGGNPSTADIIAAVEACGKGSVEGSVAPREARNFRRLVDVIRDAKSENILAAYQQAKSGAGFSNKKFAKKVIVDAIARALTSDSLEVINQLLKSNEVPIEFVKIWGPSWGFSRNPCPGSLEAATHLLDIPHFPREGVLGIGALAGRYCKINGCEGGSHAKLDALIGKLAKSVKCKAPSWEEENKQLTALKALENIGHIGNKVINQLAGCLNNAETTNRVKAAILQTLASDGCSGKAQEAALKVLQDVKQDSELRIRAYHVLVKCPSSATVNALKAILEKEPSFQVGGYIQSHLRNLRASANPEKEKVRNQLDHLRAHKKYPVDIRKFSSNYEISSLIELIGQGGNAEADIIFSQRSFLPRAVTLNVSTEIFGHAVNLLELETRAENWERPLEALLGPKGELKTHEAEALAKEHKTKAEKYKSHIEDRWNQVLGRPKRSASNPKIQQSDAPQLDVSVKVLGNEIVFVTSKGDRRDVGGIGLIDKFFDKVEEGINKVKQVDLDNSIHTNFLETEVLYPTALGFPLTLGVHGSAALHLHLDGKADIKNLINHPESSQVSLDIQPSADIELLGSLTLDALEVEAGVQVTANIHSSTGLQVQARGVEGSGIDITVGLPLQKQRILSVNTEQLTLYREGENAGEVKPINFAVKQRKYEGCFDQLSPIFGLTFCGHVSFPVDAHQKTSSTPVLNGPLSLEINVEAEDVKSYHIRTALQGNKEHRKPRFYLILPIQKQTANFECLMPKLKTLKLRKKFLYINISGKKPASATILMMTKNLPLEDKSNLTQLNILLVGVEKEGSGNRIRYTPLLEYKSPQTEQLIARKAGKGKPAKIGQGYSVDGAVIVDKNGDARKYTFDNVVIITPDNSKYALAGWLANDPQSYSTDLKTSYGNGQNYHLRGSVNIPAERQLKLNTEFSSTEHPDIGFSVKFEHSCSPEHIENNLVIVHGKDLASTDNRISLYQQGKWRLKNKDDFDLSGSVRGSYPILGVDLKLHAGVKPHEVSAELAAAYDKNKVSAELLGKSTKEGEWDVDAKAQLLENSVELKSQRKTSDDGKSKMTNKLVLTPGGTYELNTDCEHHTGKDNLQLASVLTLIAPKTKVVVDYGLVVNPHGSTFHLNAVNNGAELINVDSKIVQAPNNQGSGNIKAQIKDHLAANVEWTSTGQKSTGNLVVDLKQFDRKIIGNGELTLEKKHIIGKGDLNWDKDQTKSLHIETDTKWGNEVETNSAISLNGKKISLIGKGALQGKVTDGVISGQGDLTLPTGRKLTLHLNHELHIIDKDIKVKLDLDAADINKDLSHKVIIKVDSERSEHLIGHYSLVEYKCPHGNDLSLELQGKATCNDKDNWHTDGKVNIKGPNDLQPNLEFNVDKDKNSLKYKVLGKLATDSTLDASGSILQNQNELDISNVLELHLPTGELKQIKITDKTHVEGGKDHALKLNADYIVQWNGNAQAELTLKGQRNKNHLLLQADTKLPNQPKRSIKGEWERLNEITNDVKLEVLYNENEKVKIEAEITTPTDSKQSSLKLIAETPVDKFKKVEIFLGHKVNEAGLNTWVISADSDNKRVAASLGVEIKPALIIIDLETEAPNGKSKAFIQSEKKGENTYESEIKLEWPFNGGGTLVSTSSSRIDSPQDFQIVVDVDSPKLSLEKYHMVVANKPAKGGKALLITATSKGEPVINGKLDYRYKIDGLDYKYEADGQLKVKGQPKKALFLLERKTLTQEHDNEDGYNFIYKVQLGGEEIEASNKATTRRVNSLIRYCKTKDDCIIHIGGDWQLHNADPLKYHSEGNVKILVKPIKNLDLNIKTTTKTDGWTFDRKLVVRNSKGQEFSIHSALTTKDAITVITLGPRVIAGEARWNLDKVDSGHQAIFGADIWLDKNRQPNLKAGLIAKSEVAIKDGTALVSGSTKVTHPALGKELEVKGHGRLSKDSGIEGHIELDLFANKNQKIEIKIQTTRQSLEKGVKVIHIISVTSKGQNLDILINAHSAASYTLVGSGLTIDFQFGNIKRGASAAYELTPEHFIAFIKTPRHEVLNFEAKLSKQDKSLDFVLQVLDGYKWDLKNKIHPGGKVTSIFRRDDVIGSDFEGNFDLNRGVSVQEAVIGTLRGKQYDHKQLYKMSLNWADDKVKSVYEWDLDLAKEIIEGCKEDLEKGVQRLNHLGNQIADEAQSDYQKIAEELANYNVNFNPVLKSYAEQLESIQQEITQDELVKDLTEAFSKIVERIGVITKTIATAFVQALDALINYLNELKAVLLQTSQRLSPHISKAAKNIGSTVARLVQSVLATSLQELADFLEFIKQYDEDIKKLATVVGEIVRDFTRVVARVSQEAIHEVKEFTKVLVDQIKALSITEAIEERIVWLKESLNELSIPDELWQFLLDLINSVNQELPTPELRDLADVIRTYLENRAQKKPVDEAETLKLIGVKAGPALRSVLVLLEVDQPLKKAPTSWLGFWKATTVRLAPLVKIPSLVIHFSPINWIRSDDLPTPLHILRSHRPETLGLLDWEPPFTAHAILVDGEHFVTWDRKHFTFKGSCEYVLARDELDGNFTLSVTLANGKFKSVKLSEPKGSSLEMNADQTLKLDGKSVEYPVHQGDLHAWRNYHTTHLLSKYGVSVGYNPTHQVLLLSVNGFYFGRLRGLLGNLNYEIFDDSLAQNGALPEQTAKFANSWKVDGSCADGTAVEHHHGHEEKEPVECSKVFGVTSLLQACYPFVSSEPFREACSHTVASASGDQKQQKACNIAASYITACLQENPLAAIQLPKECVHCTVGDQTLDVGHTIPIESPQGLADVIIVIEETQPNAEVYKELVVPLMTTLSDELKAKGITDVHYSLTGYHPNSKWPSQHTSGDKLVFQGKAKGLNFKEGAEVRPSSDFPKEGSLSEKVHWLKYQWDIEVGTRPWYTALASAYKYPHRPGAAKAIIYVPTNRCETSLLWPFSLQKLQQVAYSWYNILQGHFFFVITPISDFDIEGNSKQAKNVVGFDSNTVYLNSDAKKKVLEGQPELRPKLKIDEKDTCINYAQLVGGAAFNTNNFLDAKAPGRKQFIQTTARRVAASLTRETFQECICLLDQGLFPTTECRVTRIKSDPLSENLKVKSHKG